jgi:solute:Na+ symporter, SSS family
MAIARDLKSSIYPIHIGGHVYPMYAAIPALAANLLVSAVVTAVLRAVGHLPGSDSTGEISSHESALL